MEKWIGQVAFVTGASSGIGEAIAEKLVDLGLNVVAFARRKARLEALEKKLSSKKGKFYPSEGDISKEEDILKAFQWTKENVGPVSILVNNAGILSAMDNLSDTSIQGWKAMLDVNVLGLCIATREAVKQMKENNIDGHIININSVAGHTLFYAPKLNLYIATKHAVTALTESLRLELGTQGFKIKVTSISPGIVDTEIGKTEFAPSSWAQKMVETVESESHLTSSDIADAAVYVLSTPKHVNISELTIQPAGAQY